MGREVRGVDRKRDERKREKSEEIGERGGARVVIAG